MTSLNIYFFLELIKHLVLDSTEPCQPCQWCNYCLPLTPTISPYDSHLVDNDV